MAKSTFDIYQAVTDRIIQQLEKGSIPWRKPWRGIPAINYISRKPYRGVNPLLLPFPGEYATFKQIKEKGGHVKKGEKGHMIVFYKPIAIIDKDTGEEKEIPYLRYSTVFHISQAEGIETKTEPVNLNPDIAPIQKASDILNDYITRSGVKLCYIEGSDRAYYSPGEDQIALPHIGQFSANEDYASVAFHEAAHSTGHHTRLNRDLGTASFGSKTYSQEELIAEISAAALMNIAGIELPETFENSAAYIQSWLARLQNDNKFIIKASSAAQKATDYILNPGADAAATEINEE